MRVIAGSARSLPLKTLDTKETRPTQDRIKETLFNILQGQLAGCLFLDLFSGSGGIGIEALSRGAKKVWFVENNPKAAALIRENLSFTRLSDRAVLLRADAYSILPMLCPESPFDFIFIDPPYRKGHERKILELFYENRLKGGLKYIGEDTVLIVEASLDTGFDYIPDLGFEAVRFKKYKTNQHVFIKPSRDSFTTLCKEKADK